MKQLILLILIFPTSLFSQGWIKTCGNGEGLSLQETIDGGFIISGCTLYNNYPDDVYIIKTDNNGDTLWTRTFNRAAEECGYSIRQTLDSGYIIAGFSNIYGPGDDTYLIKTDVNGDTLWTKVYHDDRHNFGLSCIQTSEGGYIICGTKINFGTSGDILLLKTNENGDTLWTKTYGGNNEERGFSVQQTNDGGYIITGSTETDSTAYDVYLIKTNEIGDTLWTKTFGGDDYDIGFSVRQTTDGGYIIAGQISNPDNYDVYLIKTNENGDTQWTKTYDGNYHTVGRSVFPTTDGGYVITGYTGSNSNGNEVYIIKTDGNGDTLWTKTYGENFTNLGYSVIETSNGMYVVAGTTYPTDNTANVLLIKVDSDGNLVNTIEIPVPNTNRKLVKIFDLTGREIPAPQRNNPYIELYNDGTTQKKMILK